MERFGRRVREVATAGGRAELVTAACAAYDRWSDAVETERRVGRVNHDELQAYDELHGRLIDILDEALRQSAGDLLTALKSLAVSDAATSPANNSSGGMSFVDFQTLLRRVTNSLPQRQAPQQVSVSAACNDIGLA